MSCACWAWASLHESCKGHTHDGGPSLDNPLSTSVCVADSNRDFKTDYRR